MIFRPGPRCGSNTDAGETTALWKRFMLPFASRSGAKPDERARPRP